MTRRRWIGGALVLAGAAALVGWRSARDPDAESSPETVRVVWTPQESQDSPTQPPANSRPVQKKKKAAVGKGPAARTAPANELGDGVFVLSNGDSYDDFVSLAEAPDGTLYAAYAAYYDGHDQIRLHKLLASGRWSTRTYVPLVEARADIWMPQLAVDAHNRLWVIWCEQTNATRTESGNWDLYARSLENDTWGPIVRLTDHPRPDINPYVMTDEQHRIHVTWQAHPENNGDIYYCRFDGQSWSAPLAVTSGPESDWYPRAAVDSHGVVWIAFDSYRRGDYDVFLTSIRDGQPGEVVPIATSRYYEAHASVACTPDGRVWVAWEQGGWNWGKDQGYWLQRNQRNMGSSLGNTRSVHVAAFRDGRLEAGPPLPPRAAEDELNQTAMAGLSTDRQGRLWLRYRRLKRGVAMGTQRRFTRYWTEHVTRLSPDGWATPYELPGSTGRISVFSRLIPVADGSVWAAYSSDQRRPPNYHQPVHDRALVARLPASDAPAAPPAMTDYVPPDPPARVTKWDDRQEAHQVAATRQHRTQVGDRSLQIVRGDLHRHTELSWDVGPGNDGSFLDFYRYMIDVAAMDFGSLTDHQGGGHYAYHWWLTEKSADLYYLPPRFVPLYGYERSASYPDGHRNIFHSYRGVPIFPFQTRTGLTGVFPGVGTGNLVSNDTQLLYQYLHGTHGIAISHTSGTDSMGTDWRDNDPAIEPVVEIYQGARNSYEAIGGPRVHDVSQEPGARAPGGYQDAGMVWNAWAKGYRLGVTASSDHGSTHISYSMVYTPANDRESILGAILSRHTYGATDNLVLEFWANGHFMGDEFTTRERPDLRLRATGTGAIAKIDLIRNNKYIYSTTPNQESVDMQYSDREPEKGLNYYYFRVLQQDGEIGWTSPIWIQYETP